MPAPRHARGVPNRPRRGRRRADRRQGFAAVPALRAATGPSRCVRMARGGAIAPNLEAALAQALGRTARSTCALRQGRAANQRCQRPLVDGGPLRAFGGGGNGPAFLVGMTALATATCTGGGAPSAVKSACCWGSDDGLEVCCGLRGGIMVGLARGRSMKGIDPGWLDRPFTACGVPCLCAEPQRTTHRGDRERLAWRACAQRISPA